MSLNKCFGTKCPLKETCIRYKPIEHKGYDIYFDGTPYRPERKHCDFYISTADNIWDQLNSDVDINID